MKYELTTKKYGRTESGKNWKSNPTEAEITTIDQETYNNIFSKETQAFFRRLRGYERTSKSYTTAGYIVTRLTSISPDKITKIVRTVKVK